jgi:hypothetical protein
LVGLPFRLDGGASSHGNSPTEAMRRAGERLFGEHGRCLSADGLKEIAEDLLGFAYKPCWIHFVPDGEMGRWDPVLTPWPLEAVQLDPNRPGQYEALTDSGTAIPIEPLHWVTFSMARYMPHFRGAVRSIGEIWMARQYAIQDAATRSGSVREAKYFGQLPEGIGIGSKEGRQFCADLQGVVRERGGMAFENGGDVKIHDASAQGHKIFFDLEKLAASDYAIAYSGQDGTTALGNQGTYGARQVLYGVGYDMLRGLARVVSVGKNEVYSRWSVLNFGRREHPYASIEVPDLEAEQARATAAQRRPLMIRELQALASRGPVPDVVVQEVARSYGQEVSPEWAATWMQPTPQPAFGGQRQQSS